MKDDQFFSEFHAAFEPRFQQVIADLYTNSHDERFSRDLLKTFLDPIIPYVKSGKRIRPFLIAVGADSLDEKVIDAGIAFELLHTYVLIHDDIMDGATMRRNVPAVHVALRDEGLNGEAGAMLVGDFLSAACNEYMAEKVPELMPLFGKMQRFLCVGQFYEMVHWGQKISPEVSKNIARFKSAQYSFMYPLQFGLTLANRDIHALDQYADSAGLAFQLRDDWMDMSDEIESGKDKMLDSQNNVPNLAQLALTDQQGSIPQTKSIVENILAEYRQTGAEVLEITQLSERQKKSLLALLTFSTNIR